MKVANLGKNNDSQSGYLAKYIKITNLGLSAGRGYRPVHLLDQSLQDFTRAYFGE
jgi:hypothetical protein